MKIIGVKWMSGKTTIGVVKLQCEHSGEIEYRIATVQGYSEEEDKKYIANWGSFFPTGAGNALFN